MPIVRTRPLVLGLVLREVRASKTGNAFLQARRTQLEEPSDISRHAGGSDYEPVESRRCMRNG